MAKTAFATSNALTKKAWEEKLFRDIRKEAYFSTFEGESKESLIQVKRKLEKDQGDKITFGIRMRLSGGGVTSGQQLEGNEEALTTHDYSVSLEEYAHAVRDKGPLDRQRAMFSIDTESVDAIKTWGAEKIDQLYFDALDASPSKVFYKTTAAGMTSSTYATAKAALVTAESKLTLAFVSFLKTWAITGGGRTYFPLRPVKVAGKKYIILLCHPDVLYDLRNNDSNFAQAMREAERRGPENPLFRHATAIWDGVVIHEHECCSIGTDGGGASVPYGLCHLMGAQSLVMAWGKRPSVVAKEFDYGREHGYAIDFILKAGKPVFDSKEYGTVALIVSRTNVSGA